MSFVVLKTLNNPTYWRSTEQNGQKQGRRRWVPATTLWQEGPRGRLGPGTAEAAAVGSPHKDVRDPQLEILTAAAMCICHLH